MKALRNEDKFVDETNLHGWLITIMRNIYINNCRRNAKVGQIADDDEDLFHIKLSRESEVDTPDGAIAVNEINAIVAGFPAEFRKPFSMHIAGYKYEEISELLKMPLGTVKGRIFSTRKRLREMLKDYR